MRQPKQAVGLVHGIDPVVKEFLQKRQADPREESDEGGEEDALHLLRAHGNTRDLCHLDDARPRVVRLFTQRQVGQLIGEHLVLGGGGVVVTGELG